MTQEQDKTIPVVELFYSIQGEGYYTGKPSIFIRLFGCNFQCNGFSNMDKDGNIGAIPIKQVDSIDQLSNDYFTKGCDSRYSWHKDYAHLVQHMTAQEIAQRSKQLVEQQSDGIEFSDVDIIFTGGEPLMNQNAIIDICKTLAQDENFSISNVTIETNASVAPKSELLNFFNQELPHTELLWSCSPKLSSSGEPRKKAWNHKVLERMNTFNASFIVFKFVVGSQHDVDEVDEYMKTVVDQNNIIYDRVYLMPVGATVQQQVASMPFVANQCMRKGYNLSARVHVFAFGNELGT